MVTSLVDWPILYINCAGGGARYRRHAHDPSVPRHRRRNRPRRYPSRTRDGGIVCPDRQAGGQEDGGARHARPRAHPHAARQARRHPQRHAREDLSQGFAIHASATISVVFPSSPCFNNLVMFDPANPVESPDNVVPELAERWSWQDNYRNLVMFLRRTSSGTTDSPSPPRTSSSRST